MGLSQKEKSSSLKTKYFHGRDIGYALSWVFVFTIFYSCQKKSGSDVASNPGQTASANGAAIRFGFQPNEAKADLKRFAEDMSAQIQAPVTTFVSQDYAELTQKLSQKELDFAFFSPINFVEAESKSGAKVLLKKVYGKNEFYYSAIVVSRASKVKFVAELKGQSIGLVDVKSASGYLYPLLLFRESGVAKENLNLQFLGTHDAAVEALKKGRVAAIGTWADTPESNRGAWNSEPSPSDCCRVLKYSDPIPNDAFVVREDYYQSHPMIVYRVMEAMISMGERGALKDMGVDAMATATSRHYDVVRKLVQGGL